MTQLIELVNHSILPVDDIAIMEHDIYHKEADDLLHVAIRCSLRKGLSDHKGVVVQALCLYGFHVQLSREEGASLVEALEFQARAVIKELFSLQGSDLPTALYRVIVERESIELRLENAFFPGVSLARSRQLTG